MNSQYLQAARGTIAAVVVLLSGNVVFAQYGGVPRYEPSRPTVSPYLNLLRGDAGVLPNYYSFVRPMERHQQAVRQTSLQLHQQRAELEQVRSELGQSPVAPTGNAGWFGVRGTQGHQQTGHYYSRWQRGGRR